MFQDHFASHGNQEYDCFNKKCPLSSKYIPPIPPKLGLPLHMLKLYNHSPTFNGRHGKFVKIEEGKYLLQYGSKKFCKMCRAWIFKRHCVTCTKEWEDYDGTFYRNKTDHACLGYGGSPCKMCQTVIPHV